MSTLGDALRAATGRLGAAGVEAARLDARVLIAHALGIEPLSVVTRQERVLTAEEEEAVEALIARREHREPVSHIVGRREFWSLSFTVTAATLAPRPDSETIVETALDHIADRQAPLRVLDFGTGTGCLLLALLSELPNARGIGIDRSQAALTVAGDNARRLGLAQRAEFRLGDWGRGLDGLFDVIISNP
ncbi:MAG: peptide chain release factor N(5)-glutamine methyltransferase, partial [Rhodospirillales bacterium]|nr:peptide chain release factor N(5)-glutamine methyltransferase [Rhodospirillales bacterium]